MTPRDLPAPDSYAHGTRARYNAAKCRCDDCRAANTRYERERVARVKAVVLSSADSPSPSVPQPQTWTAPDGTKRERVYSRACAGVNGHPCPTRSHLRKDSTGSVCRRCRQVLAYNGLVSADTARNHLRELARMGVGTRSVHEASDVALSVLCDVKTGVKRNIRAATERAILAVDAGAIADHALVDGVATWRLIDELLEHGGFTRTELARRLGLAVIVQSRQSRCDRVLAITAHRVARLYREMEIGDEIEVVDDATYFRDLVLAQIGDDPTSTGEIIEAVRADYGCSDRKVFRALKGLRAEGAVIRLDAGHYVSGDHAQRKAA